MPGLPGFEAMDANLRRVLRGFCGERGGEAELDGISIRFSGENFAMFNAAVISSPVSQLRELERRIRAAAEYYQRAGAAWSVWACEDWFGGDLKTLSAIAFDHCGLHFVLDLPGMSAARLAPPSRELPQLEYRPVADAASRAAFAQLMAACFGIPIEIARPMYERERLYASGFTGWLGYAGDLAIASAATLVEAGIAGVYSVATLPPFERRGYGEAIIRYALARVHDETGIEASVLQSSADGYGLYRRMGYEPVTRYVVWASQQ